MSYYESAEGETISRKRAQKEVSAHQADWSEFIAECGDRDTYDAQEVLRWLGY